MMNKYRVHEVAKDLKLSTKEITEILTKYSQTPKNHMQVLEDRELAIIFDYVTQKNQIDSMESI
jgi:translation initiation factor IF-2